ncbi:MAG: hypothetical protein J1D99_04340 [Campylobacter sp.]|nr:hypothetical protein [Campylobacter sp.]
MEKFLVELIYSSGFLSVFLLLGFFLRAKIKIFGQLFLPASVIGGFVLLILGPNGLNFLKIPDEWMKIYALLPGILLVPVVASVPLGLNLNSGLKSSKNVLPFAFIMLAVAMMQFAIGFSTQFIFNHYDFYETFGWELGIGFVGGHGTAGLLGSMLKQANLPYWELAQGVGVTMATFGLIGGILLGMVLINIASRKKYTQILNQPADIPNDIKIGYTKDIEAQPSFGRQTTLSASLDSLAFHLAIILGVCAGAYFILNFIKEHSIPILNQISIWAYAIVIMFGVWGFMVKFKLDFLVDDKIKSRIAGTLTEFAVIAAIASLPIKTIIAYLNPILFMVIIGFITTTLVLVFMCKFLLNEYWFEHMIAGFGACTGVFLTGILLLRICDPNFKSPVMANYSLSYTILSVVYFVFLQLILSTILTKSLFWGFMLCVFSFAAFLILALVFAKFKIRN